jgi:hypothetical protein
MPTLTGIAGKLLTGSVSRVDELFGEKKILAFDGAAGARFGYSVAAGSGRIVVGAYGDNDNQGSVYIHDLNGNLLNKITASDGAASDYFGQSVAVGDDRIVVGAFYGASTYGSAYIFDLDGNQLAKLTASDGAANDYFGFSVAIGSDKIVVGAYRDTVGANIGQGSAYIFDLDGTQLTKITASDGASGDYFGYSVAIGDNKIVVGAYGTNGNGSGSNSGSVYVFDLDGTQLTKITASDGAGFDRFGWRVDIGNGKIVVGSYLDDDNVKDSGSVYTYNLDGTNEIKIIPSDGAASDYFGQSVAIGDNKIVVAAPGYDIDPITNNFNSGKIYTYDLDGTNELIITNSNLTFLDALGESLAVGNGRLVAGIRDDDNGQDSGAVYIYKTANT